ncbi:DNA helicase [Halopseudomonas oceani]|uniref:DNA 3'-5' helicase n=1 Tax=Halopseudomonas oceani TaxID=1708783 RepID=A0A2P4ERB9_9GAMM|nr:3'-5' exonuclease [Halopseudomonas oceani]POB01208.1 ATP-dependent helicase [Halopseudomonas oceani]GGE56802.1 DNA helicase [Halopseudomonas oceani]
MEAVIYTKKFNGYLRSLQEAGQKKIVQAVRAAMAEAGTNGSISSLPRTKHGESRLKNVEKFDLPGAYRLVVQLVDGVKKTRAFLFVGDHDDAERWLDSHRNYTWVKSPTDGTLNFMPATYDGNRHVPVDRLDLDSPESELQAPLLRFLSDDDWSNLKCNDNQMSLAKRITGAQFEQDADGILVKLDELGDYDSASTLFDLFVLAHNKDWAELNHRVLIADEASVVSEDNTLQAEMRSIANAEHFVTFDDEGMLDEFFGKKTFSDWMLFLHPEQKKIVQRDYKGPVRLRGVSGSGKTSVLVHRARFLAKKYHQPVVLVTLTESMRKLLEKLVDELCGAEKSLIQTKTMNSFARDVLSELQVRINFAPLAPEAQQVLMEDAIATLKDEAGFSKTPMGSMQELELRNFLKEEFEYVRGRLCPSEFERYLDSSLFNRRGRAIALNKSAREMILKVVVRYAAGVESKRQQDHELLVSQAVERMSKESGNVGQYRSVLVDEVQDLTELDVVLLSKLKTPEGEVLAHVENGIFLAGDGAQSIYKRGFALKRAGIDVVGRSVSLKKNYRNTHEILTAAFNLVSKFEFSDTDEDDLRRPSLPDFAKRHGEKPWLIQCQNQNDEVEAVANKVQSLLAMGQTAGQICIIAPQNRLREEVRQALTNRDIQSAELRQDIDYESDNVKISTIESAKGHEFATVFIMGLVEGVMPQANIQAHEESREASRLYVAMTRARESLYLTYNPTPGYPASRFLMSIQDDCREARYRSGEFQLIEA